MIRITAAGRILHTPILIAERFPLLTSPYKVSLWRCLSPDINVDLAAIWKLRVTR
jgi:hypothetical protein